MTDEQKLELERKELDLLIQRGVSFECKDVEFVTETHLFGLIKRKVKKDIVRKFEINEPTLGTLDRLSREWIELAIDEEKAKSSEAMRHARTMAHRHSIRCCRIIALAVLDTDLLIPKPGKGGNVVWVEDTKRLNELTNLFARNIKPSTQNQICVLINTMSNLGDFMNSIRLMLADRTTMPIRIEEKAGV